jgi:hypothetical protein
VPAGFGLGAEGFSGGAARPHHASTHAQAPAQAPEACGRPPDGAGRAFKGGDVWAPFRPFCGHSAVSFAQSPSRVTFNPARQSQHLSLREATVRDSAGPKALFTLTPEQRCETAGSRLSCWVQVVFLGTGYRNRLLAPRGVTGSCNRFAVTGRT